MTIALTSALSIRGELATAGEGGIADLQISEGLSKAVTNGTGIDQSTHIYIDEFSIAASGNLTIDLAGALADRHGNAAVFTAIKEVMVIADAANVNNVIYGNATAGWLGPFDLITDTMTILPGNRIDFTNYSAAGWAVTATTADMIKLTNSGAGTAVTGTIVIIGEA